MGVEKKMTKKPPSSLASDESVVSMLDVVKEGGSKIAKMKSSGSRAHLLLRWPLGIFLLLLLVVEVTVYFLIRMLVVLLEMTVARRSYTKEGVDLHNARKTAEDYEEYSEICKKLDAFENRDEWKNEKESIHYDAELIEESLEQCREARERGDVGELLDCMVLLKNFGGIQNLPLYNKTWYGTKTLIHDYVEETVKCLELIATYHTTDVKLIEKRVDFLKTSKTEFGNTSLSLSGGAMLGIYHLGVVKALLINKMLPKHLSGSSAGAVMVAFVCCKTDEQLMEDFKDTTYLAEMLSGDKGPFPGSKLWQFQQVLTKGHTYEVTDFLQCIRDIIGDVTFKEAYETTGRTMVIPCTPVKSKVRGAPTIMLSHVTAPDVPVAYAVAASCTVPYLMPSVGLVEKVRGPDGNYLKKDGEFLYKPYLDTITRRMSAHGKTPLQTHDKSVQMRDGTFQSDFPMKHLLGTHNCKFNFVAQTNPHVLPFFFSHRGEAGKPVKTWHREGGGWRGGFILSLAEYVMKEEMIKNLKIMSTFRLLFDHLGVDWSTIYLQDFKGDLTLTPPLYPTEYWRLMQNLPKGKAGKEILDRRLAIGENITWKSIPLLRSRIDIQNALDAAYDRHVTSQCASCSDVSSTSSAGGK